MMPIYDADTLRKVSSDARLAEFNYVRDNYVPKALCKINEANFTAANAGRSFSHEKLNLLVMGLATEESQNYLRIGLKTELETLGLKVDIVMRPNGMMEITCRW